jgi:hypothetical protein
LAQFAALLPVLAAATPTTVVAASTPLTHQHLDVGRDWFIAPGQTITIPVRVANTYGQPLALYLSDLSGTPGMDLYDLRFTVGTDYLGCLPTTGRTLDLQLSLGADADDSYLGQSYDFDFQLHVQTDPRCQ